MEKEKREVREIREEREVFNTSKKTVKSPDLKKEVGGEMEETIRRLMREKLEKVIKKMKKVKGWKEEIKKIKEGN